MAHEPKTLQEAIQYFADPNNCIDYLAIRRWGKDGVVCPICGSREVSFMPSRRVWQCKTRHPKCQFSIKVGTIFEDSPIGLDKWLTAMWMLANCKNGASSWEIHRTLGVTQKSAWFMLQRIRLALQDKQSGGKLGGGSSNKVEVDETFIGGKARNMHKSRREHMKTVGKYNAKTAVFGMLERGGKVKAQVVGERRGKQLKEIIEENVMPGTWVMSDEFPGYVGLDEKYFHLVVNHLQTYVSGNVHTQGIENFWSLLKRTLGGTYVSVEPFHLFRYVDEQAFRFNNRKDVDGNKLTDADRFDIAVSQIIGKRLTYAEVTGKVGETAF
jgi:transposase-like protein